MRSGDQNWVSVSRAIKPFSEPGRPPDWFSQKHCASQYSELLETTEAPKRKRGEKGEVVETIEDVIVRRLTAERIEELKKLLRDTQDKYRKLKKEVDLIQTGHLDSRLEELWTDITQKNKQDEDEADLKRKATETSYQARQAVKNTPKRVSSVTVRSPLGASPTSMEGAQTDTPTPPIDTAMPQSQGGAVFLPSSDAPMAGPKEGSLGSLVDDSPQKRLLSQKSTPPPSPLLSELLKKGSLISASPRLVVEGDVAAAGLANGGVPTTTPAITADFEVASAGNYGNREVTALAGRLAVMYAGSEVVEEDHLPGSYMGDELDLETVGDIISIIEEKVDDSVEALDAAAVEAALSLCEEAVSAGHSLSGPWEAQDLKASEPGPTVQSDPTHGLQAAAGANPGSLEPQTESGRGEAEEGNGKNCEGQETVQTNVAPSVVADDGLKGSEVTEEGVLGEEGALSTAVKTENEGWTQPELNTPCLDSEDSSGSGKESKEVKDEDGGSDGDPDEGMEMKECGEGEGPYLSEVEPAASESEDGYGPSSQRYTTADSLASSPASSQFSICGEDQEAVQAQKIWKKAIMLVWRAAANHRYASVFLQSVSEDIAPGYHSIVHRPMDLSAIKKSIEAGQIRTTAEFQRDIMLMFQNAVMYNSSDHDVFHMALEMQRDVLEHVQQFLATQLIMQTSESSISTKSLRGREGGRKPGESVEKVRLNTHTCNSQNYGNT
uniref:Bromodomain-containing protein 8 n=1 Tax=Hucho hucho TaxID=62062 RepID=A0A4W5QTP7_9TELE